MSKSCQIKDYKSAKLKVLLVFDNYIVYNMNIKHMENSI